MALNYKNQREMENIKSGFIEIDGDSASHLSNLRLSDLRRIKYNQYLETDTARPTAYYKLQHMKTKYYNNTEEDEAISVNNKISDMIKYYVGDDCYSAGKTIARADERERVGLEGNLYT